MKTRLITFGGKRPDGGSRSGIWADLVEYYAVNYPGLDGVCIDDHSPTVQFWFIMSGKRHTEIHRFENDEQAEVHYNAILQAMGGKPEVKAHDSGENEKPIPLTEGEEHGHLHGNGTGV